MIDPDFYVHWDDQSARRPRPTPRPSGRSLPDDAFNRTVLGDPEVVASVQFGAASGREREDYLELWQER